VVLTDDKGDGHMFMNPGTVTPAAAGGGLAAGNLPYTGSAPLDLALTGLVLIVAGFTILFALRSARNLAPTRR
jgi:hypothetical protein